MPVEFVAAPHPDPLPASGEREEPASEPHLDARVDLLGKGVDDRADERRGDGGDRRMTMIFGMKVSVTSCTWVKACSRAMTMPTAIAAATAGPQATITVHSAD